MALGIITENGQEFIWNVGQPSPILTQDVPSVSWIQLDGDELSHLEATGVIRDLPDNKFVRYYGDAAKYVVGNLLKH